MPDFLIRQLPEKTLKKARRLAALHKKSLQEELRELLVGVIETQAGAWSMKADHIRAQIVNDGKSHTDSTSLLRDDRSR